MSDNFRKLQRNTHVNLFKDSWIVVLCLFTFLCIVFIFPQKLLLLTLSSSKIGGKPEENRRKIGAAPEVLDLFYIVKMVVSSDFDDLLNFGSGNHQF